MKFPFFSIIIPVFNGMPFIRDCLENLCNQTFTDFEIILIDDGSTDKSDEVCKQYKEKDSRITYYIRNIHCGVSHSRNCGLQLAKGDWILFTDCDDLYDMNTLEIVKTTIEKTPDVDLISGIFSRIDTNNEIISIFPHKRTGVFSFGEYVQNESFYPAGVCGHAIKRSIIANNNLKFNEDLQIAEDALFMLHYCAYIQNVVLSNKMVYQYRINPNSTMHTHRTIEKIESQLSAAVMMYDANNSNSDVYKKLKKLRAHNTLALTILNVAQSQYTLKDLITILKSISSKSKHIGFISPQRILYKYTIYKIKELIKKIIKR